ncbi:MAG TPA: glycosyltransferase, partial [Acidimicrobiia bacterium]|nr:glycosyltransferase [Acidimicrobiia bacterium]
MRVLHVINSLAGSGGAEQGLVREITHFDPSVVSLVVRLFENDDLEARLTSRGIDVVWLGLRSSASAWSWPEAARRVRRLIRSFRPDIVHTSLFTGNLVGQLAAMGTGVPVLSTLTLTGDERLHRELQPGADTRRAAVLRHIAARIGRQSHIRYRAISEDAAETNCKSMGIDRARVTVITRGVPMVSVEPDRSRFGIPET